MDENADPCERFYDYACGKWNAYHPIPKDRGGYDTFEILREDLDAKLISMLEERITEADSNSTSAVKILYSSCMNTSKQA
ncbi:MAG: M13 family metallopeptidase N-terminal domain-containing protein [Nitrospinaceae bacterium]